MISASWCIKKIHQPGQVPRIPAAAGVICFCQACKCSPRPEWLWRSPQLHVTLEVPNNYGNRLSEAVWVWFLRRKPRQAKRLQELRNMDPLMEVSYSHPGCPHLEHHSKLLGGDLGYRLVPRQDPRTDRLQTLPPSFLHLRWRSTHHPPLHVGNLARI